MSRSRTLATVTLTAAALLTAAGPAAFADTPLDHIVNETQDVMPGEWSLEGIITDNQDLLTGEQGYAFAQNGECSARSGYLVDASGSTEGDTIRVTAGVDSNRAAQSWSWQLLHNGVRFASGTATTQDPSGAFTVRRQTNDLLGPDTIRFRATNPRTGESCDGQVTLP